MLLKPKKKFRKISEEQLDLVETIDEVDKTKKRRLTIIIFLILTVGLSLCFILYRQFKSLNLKEIKLPNISSVLLLKNNPKFSPDIPENWSLLIKTIGTTNFYLEQNLLSPPDTNKIKNPNNPSYAKKYLPDGVVVTEKTNNFVDYLEVVSQIQTPKTNFEIYTKIPGKITTNSTELDVFSRLVESIYWYLLK